MQSTSVLNRDQLSDEIPSAFGASGRPSRVELLGVVLILMLTFVTYIPSFDTWFTEHEFIHIGGAALTPTGAFFQKIWSLSDGGESLFHTNALYRPLFYSHVWLEYRLFGLNPFGFHVFSVGFHLVNVALVWVLARTITGNTTIALIGAGIFGLHPGPVDAVNWLSIINDLVMATFGFLALTCLLRSWKATGSSRAILYGLSLGFVVLALAEKEAAGSLCLLLPAAYVLLVRPSRKDRREWLLWLLPILCDWRPVPWPA